MPNTQPEKQRIQSTIDRLKTLKNAREHGYRVCYTTDIRWLIQMAINRRAGWPDDTSLFRGSCCPVAGKYPIKAEGDVYGHLQAVARKLNTPGLIVRKTELGEWKSMLLRKIRPDRFFDEDCL